MFSLPQDALIDMLRRSRVHFVHCLLPRAEVVGGAGEPRGGPGESLESGLMTLDVGLLRAQLRGSKLLDALRIHRQGNGRRRRRQDVPLSCCCPHPPSASPQGTQTTWSSPSSAGASTSWRLI